MDPANGPVTEMLNEIADILEITGTDRFRPLAYRRASRTLEALPKPVSEYVRNGSISELAGVGEAIAQKITEFVRTGKLEYLENLRKSIPPGLLEMLKLQDVGPKTVGRLFAELKVTTIDELEKACREKRVSPLKGFGERTEEKLLQSIDFYRSSGGRFLLSEAGDIAQAIVAIIGAHAERIEIAGSLRRRRETVGDVDIIASSADPDKIIDAFVSLAEVRSVLSKGETKSSISLKNGLQVDLRVVEDSSFGAALLYFTGSKDHNVLLRTVSIEKGYKLNEYGLFGREGGTSIAGRSEQEIYTALAMQYIPPELREARGEIDAASEGRLPTLVLEGDILGDMHCHTDWSDGSSTLEEMVAAAEKRGYQYIGITDHSKSEKVANGLSEERMERQIERISELNDSGRFGVKVLCGSEVDIMPDGSLDYSDKILSGLDFAVCSIHSRFNMDKKEMTERLLTAISNPHMTIFGHPTAREIGRREQISFDADAVFSAASQNSVLLEADGSPERLDLSDALIIEAKKHSCKFVLDSDAHHHSSLSNVRYAVSMARRGWLGKKDVANTLDFSELSKTIL
jgi:DNA polymerase (family 10)